MVDGFIKGDMLVGVMGGIFKCIFGEICIVCCIN